MLFNARIKELEALLATATGERDTLATTNADLITANEEFGTRYNADQTLILSLTGERDSALAQVGTLTTERDTAVSELAREREGRDEAIRTQVDQRLASAGVAPIARDPAATAKTEPKPETPGVKGMAKARAYFADRQPKAPEAASN